MPHAEQAWRLYRAVLTPLRLVTFEFDDVEMKEALLVESTSNVYDVLFDLDNNELRFTAAGPAGTRGRATVTAPPSLFEGPYAVTVDGQTAAVSVQGGEISFEYAHAGRSSIVIRGGA